MRTGIRSNSMALPGRDLDRRDEPGRLGVEDDEQQERVPERDLEPGPIRGEERDGDQIEVDQEADRTLGAAGAVHREGEIEAIEQEQEGQQREPEAIRSPADDFEGRRHGEVAEGRRPGAREVDTDGLGPEGRPGNDDRAHREAQDQQVAHPVAERGVFGSLRRDRAVGAGHRCSSSWNSSTTSAFERGAFRIFGSRASRKPWTSRNSQDRDHQDQREAERRGDGGRCLRFDHDRDAHQRLAEDGIRDRARIEAGNGRLPPEVARAVPVRRIPCRHRPRAARRLELSAPAARRRRRLERPGNVQRRRIGGRAWFRTRFGRGGRRGSAGWRRCGR